MKTIRYTIASAIFEKVPGYIRGLIIVNGADNGRANSAVQSTLRETEACLAARFTLETLLAEPRITAWRDAFKLFSMNPSEFRPAHEALARRAVQSKQLPFINSLVDIGNSMSLAKLMPIGVHPIENVTGELSLGTALGMETFVPFGSTKTEQPTPGEVIFRDAVNVQARAWVWRQAQCSVTLPTTRNVVVHVDVLPPLDMSTAKATCGELTQRITEACGGTADVHFLSASSRSVDITSV
jgi:DNA/RNA-binding domain of Phe-tRNA-synthetase-like protein